MLKKILVSLAVAVCATGTQASAQMLLAGYGFESSHPTGTATTVNYTPDSGTGSGTAVHASNATVYTTLVGNGSASSLSSNHWAISDYYQFSTSTTGATGIYVTFGMYRSSTGPATFNLQYSLNGSTFTTVTNVANSTGSTAAGSPFTVDSASGDSFSATSYTAADEFTADLTGITALNNAPTVYFRLTAASAPSGTTGTARVDDFNISTGGFVFPVPEPSTYAAMALGGLGALAMLRYRRRNA